MKILAIYEPGQSYSIMNINHNKGVNQMRYKIYSVFLYDKNGDTFGWSSNFNSPEQASAWAIKECREGQTFAVDSYYIK